MADSDATFAARAIALKSEHPDWGYGRIAQELGWTKDKARRAINAAERRGIAALPQSGVLRYDAAKRALADAVTFDEVRDWEDKAAAVKEYGRRIGDRSMVIDAMAIQSDAHRRRGQLIGQMKDLRQLTEGRKKPPEAGQPPRVTLKDLGVTKDESTRDQKIAALDGDSYARLVARCAAHAEANPDVHSFNVLKPPPLGAINGARSIMGDRHEDTESLDYFPTPPWATRALVEHTFRHLGIYTGETLIANAWEPACGEGHISGVLTEYFDVVLATDVFQYDPGLQEFVGEHDFIANDWHGPPHDWIITNPPFGAKAIQFVLRALDLAKVGVAMFFRSQWAVEGIERYESLFRDNPPTVCAFFVERVNLCKGEWNPHGGTATAYCWLVWVKGAQPKPTFWIPPGCRKSLTRPDDIARFAPQYLDAKEVELECDPETGEIAA